MLSQPARLLLAEGDKPLVPSPIALAIGVSVASTKLLAAAGLSSDHRQIDLSARHSPVSAVFFVGLLFG